MFLYAISLARRHNVADFHRELKLKRRGMHGVWWGEEGKGLISSGRLAEEHDVAVNFKASLSEPDEEAFY